MSRVFFDTEFTSLLDPHLLSVGLVTLDGRECYAEFDMSSEFGRARLAITPWDVRESNLDKFGDVDGPDVLYLDFDGVLHPESVWWSRRRGAFLDANLAAQGHRLFEHSHLLEQLLEPYPTIQIVLSTSWVRTYSYSGACKRLSETLRQRCVGATFHSQMFQPGFEAQPRGVQVLSDVRRRRPHRWLALDDVNDGWGEHLDDVVLTNELEGIANAPVLAELQRKLSRFQGSA